MSRILVAVVVDLSRPRTGVAIYAVCIEGLYTPRRFQPSAVQLQFSSDSSNSMQYFELIFGSFKTQIILTRYSFVKLYIALYSVDFN